MKELKYIFPTNCCVEYWTNYNQKHKLLQYANDLLAKITEIVANNHHKSVKINREVCFGMI